MRTSLRGAIWRLAVFAVAAALGVFALFSIFAQLRFEDGTTYGAEFSNISGLQAGQFVRIAGVEVGKVTDIAIKPNNDVLVHFTADDSVILTKASRAVIRYDDLIGGRYLALEEGPGSTDKLRPGGTIPLANTSPALNLDALIGGFRPLFRALNPDQVNALSGQLIKALQGQGATIGSFLNQTAALTNSLADRDQLIGQVIVNLNTVVGSLGDQSKNVDTAVASLSELVDTLAHHKDDISNSVAYTNAAANSVADLLAQARTPLKKVVAETDRSSSLVVADHDYMDNLLNTLPEAYQQLGRQGLYGDFFSFYLCEIVLKINGKGGQPVYIKLAGQDTGRCTPR